MSPLAPPRRSARGHPEPNQPPPRKKRKTNSPSASKDRLRLAVRTETPVEPTLGKIERAWAAAAGAASSYSSRPSSAGVGAASTVLADADP